MSDREGLTLKFELIYLENGRPVNKEWLAYVLRLSNVKPKHFWSWPTNRKVAFINSHYGRAI